MNINATTESQRKRLIQRFVKKVVVYNDKIDIYLIAGVDTIDSNDEVKDIVELDDKNKEKLYLGKGCLILECERWTDIQ